MTFSLQNTIFNTMPIINQVDALDLFQEMDATMWYCIGRIVGLESTVSGLVDISAEIAASLTHGRIIFNREAKAEPKVKADPGAKAPKNYGASAKLEDLLLHSNAPDVDSVEFLRKIFKIFNLWSGGKVSLQDLRNLKLCRATYELLVRNFMRMTESYTDLCLKAAQLRERLHDCDPESATALASELGDTEIKMLQVETKVGCSRTSLFGLRLQVQNEMEHYAYCRHIIYSAYLRVVYKEAREKATVEQQVLENFQNGSIGLLRAISNYNPGRGVFSSYAKTWALQMIRLKLKEEANTIRLPISMWQVSNDLGKIVHRLAAENEDHTVETEKVAEEAGLGSDRVMKVFDYFQNSKVISVENQLSLDSNGNGEESYDPYEGAPFIDDHLGALTERQAFILNLSYGMFERLPGDLPTDPLRLQREAVRQKLALRAQGRTKTLNSELA